MRAAPPSGAALCRAGLLRLVPVFVLVTTFAGAAGPTAAEARWIAVLSADAPVADKLRACVELQVLGSEHAVPHLAPLLSDPALGHAARHALSGIPSAAAGRALREALHAAQPPDAIGLIASLAGRRDPEAVPLLVRLAESADTASADRARAAVAALGEIGGADARRTLERLLASPSLAVTAGLALVRDGDRARIEGDGPTAARAAAVVLASAAPEAVREAALRLQLLAEPGRLGRRWRDALLGEDPRARRVALGVTAELPTSGFRELAREVLPRLGEDERAALLDLWRQRADPPDVSDVLPLLDHNSAPVRAAAVRVLTAVGDASAVPALLRLAVSGGNERAAARVALTRLRGPGVTSALVAALSSTPDGLQTEALRALGERGDTAAFPAILPLASSEVAAVRNGALRALAGLAEQKDFDALLRLVSAHAPGSRADEAAQAVALALARQLERPGPVFPAPLAAALRSESAGTRAALLARVAVASHPVLREAVRAGLEDGDAAVRSAAREALFRTNDPGLLDEALFLASAATTDRERDAAARTVVRLLRGPGSPETPERVAVLRALADAALTDGQRRAVLDGLTAVPPGVAVRLALEWLDRPERRAAALASVVAHAPRVANPRLATLALRRALAQAEEAEMLRAIAAALEQVHSRRDYLAAWRFARFASPGTPPDRLLDAPFPPDSPLFDPSRPNRGGTTPDWRDLDVATDARRPALLRDGDGSRHGVAYALTWLRAAERTTVRLVLGASSDVRVLLNRRVIAERRDVRESDPLPVTLELEAGWNEVMLKLPETTAGWSFTARLETAPDAPEILPWTGEVDAPRIVRENAPR